MSSPDPQPLGYAPRPRPHARLSRRIVLAMAAIVIATIAWQRGPAVWNRAMLLYWQRQCLNYTAPAGQVVYDNAPADAAKYVAAGGTYLAPTNNWYSPNRSVGRVPDVVTRYFVRGELVGLTSDQCVLFAHELISPGGTRRLVIVDCSDRHDPGTSLPSSVGFRSIEVSGWRTGAPAVIENWMIQALGGMDASIQIFAGQIDPNDPSHFTIRFRRTEDGVIEGRMTDDGYVHLEYRGSPKDGFNKPIE